MIYYWDVLSDFIHCVPSRNLRSADSNLLFVPRIRTCFGSRSFAVAAPVIWNTLPLDIHISVYSVFVANLKLFTIT